MEELLTLLSKFLSLSNMHMDRYNIKHTRWAQRHASDALTVQ